MRECGAIQVGDQTPEHMPSVTTSQRGGDISVNYLTVSSGSARNYTFGERNDGSREDIVASPGSQSDTTVNAPTIDNGCWGGNVTYPCLNTSVGPDLAQEDPFVITVINRVQLAITCAGFLANGATYLTLSCNGGALFDAHITSYQTPVTGGHGDMRNGSHVPSSAGRELVDRKSYC